MNYTVKSSPDTGMEIIGKGEGCKRKHVLNSCLIVGESEISREREYEHRIAAMNLIIKKSQTPFMVTFM